MRYTDLKDELYARLHSLGVKGVFANWNEAWLHRIASIPPGIIRDKEINEGLTSFIACHRDVIEGKNIRIVPFLDDEIPENKQTAECKAELKALHEEMDSLTDEENNTDAKQEYLKDKYWALVEKYKGAA